ncbi:actin-like ATPase domain-containing protein [Meredithblackwellia eburnea MCA 4105]
MEKEEEEEEEARKRMDVPLASPMNWDPHTIQLQQAFPFHQQQLEPSESDKDSKEAQVFLGLDLSTQALKATFLDGRGQLDVLAEFGVRFDDDLPEFGTKSGVHLQPEGTVTSPIKMWLKALDLIFHCISSAPGGRHLLARTSAVGGAAQQHASVFWSAKANQLLSSLDPELSLATQLFSDTDVGAFTKDDSPNWQDSSTGEECREFGNEEKGKGEVVQKTGSRPHERFTGPQIMKLRKLEPTVYQRTERISLASSFLTTLFAKGEGEEHKNEIAKMDESDACGMNLWNIERSDWDNDLLALVSGDTGEGKDREELRRKLGQVEKDGRKVCGKIRSWWCDRWGINRDCLITPFTGDNPSTLLSFTLLSGDVIVSLGTSDTILISTTTYHPSGEYHVFTYPANYPEAKEGKRSFMGMVCYKNGSLPRELVRDNYAGGEWGEFNELVKMYPQPKDEEDAREREVGFWWLKPEIVPHNGFGIHKFDKDGNRIEEFKDPKFNPLAILESQFLSFRLRAKEMLVDQPGGRPNRIFAVGGGSSNPVLLQILSNILGANVFLPKLSSTNSCSIGGALKAYWAYNTLVNGEDLCFEDSVRRARGHDVDGRVGEARLVARPDWKVFEAFGEVMDRFADCERRLCEGLV